MSQVVLKKWLGRLGDRYFNSIRSRVTATTLLIFMFSTLAMGYYNSLKLHDDIEKTIGAQQLSSATILAGTINTELENRIKALEATAKMITSEMIKNQTVAQKNKYC